MCGELFFLFNFHQIMRDSPHLVLLLLDNERKVRSRDPIMWGGGGGYNLGSNTAN